MAVVSITHSVIVAKIKPTSFRWLRSAIAKPSVHPSVSYGRQKVHNRLAKKLLRGMVNCRPAKQQIANHVGLVTNLASAAARTPSPETNTPVHRAGWCRY